MTKREMNLRVFQRKPIPQLLFQPRIEPWFDWQKQFGNLSEGLRDLSVAELYDDLGLSMRYVDYYTGQPSPIRWVFDPAVRLEYVDQGGGERLKVFHTPRGPLIERETKTIDNTWRTIGFAVKDAEDLERLDWLYAHLRFEFDLPAFQQGAAYIGDRGVPQFWVPKSPYQALCQTWMTLEDFLYALADEEELVERVMARIDAAYDSLYEKIVASGAVSIVNFGENIHAQLLSPAYFEKYLLPFYSRRCAQLKQAGIFSHVHIDGYFRPLLPYLSQLPQDGIEALTPTPQGDVDLEEIAEHIGDKIALDLIPAVYFLPLYDIEVLQACVEKIARLFAPNVILGISDELPEAAGEEELEKVRWVSEFCHRFKVSASRGKL